VAESMRQLIQGVSQQGEITIVLLSTFGLFIFDNVLFLLHPTANPPISQHHLESLLIYESIVLAVVCSFLYVRGWTIERIGLHFTARETLIGLGLVLAFYVVYVLVWWVVYTTGYRPSYLGHFPGLVESGIALPVAAGACIVNPVYEETFLCGYIITTAKEMNRTTAGVNVSVAVRLLCHLYQGGVGVLGIVPVGLIFAWWYARTGRLWPLFVAHAVLDAIGLMRFVR
jgi:membrane protease YdiL (CAAX protease family)